MVQRILSMLNLSKDSSVVARILLLFGLLVPTAPAVEPDVHSWWSFRPISRPAPPQVSAAHWTANPIDHFILATLEANSLQPAPAADKTEWVRRVYFDLLGLPPSVEEIREFANDSRADAYERLIDRLLNSPQYGERSAQHWLDVVRFAETEGFEYDRHIPDAWRYRDYVIQAFNQDKPFDQFILEQLAGDEIDPNSHELLSASIFHRLGPVRRNAGNPEVAISRNEILTERTDIVGVAFLGLTVGCARCHDHKLDPIPQKDYYRLQAYLAATEENDVILASEEERNVWKAKTKLLNDQMRALRKELENTEDGARRDEIRNRLVELEREMPPQPPTIPAIRNDAAQRTAIHVLKRGNWEQKGERVGPRPLGVLARDDTAELPADTPNPRTILAEWLIDPQNPLTARVIANRLWQAHFGQGLVKTANDFGTHGDRPSHPELLDWLASELIRQNWRLKPLHRLILLSNTYRQSSTTPYANRAAQKDPDNRWLWKQNRRRLSAEEIRDAMLSIAGKLNRKAGGRSVIPPADQELVNLLYKPSQWEVTSDPAEHYRRSIYLIAKRNLRLPFMEVFDQPALQTSCALRPSSTHAPQALELLNGKFSNELAHALAERLRRDCGTNHSAWIERAYLLAAGRPPTQKEQELALAFLDREPLEEFALALFNLNEFLYVR